jgi:hypothetical protein
MRKHLSVVLIIVVGVAASACKSNQKSSGDHKSNVRAGTTAPVAAANKYDWKSLFDGKSLGKWKVTDFAGHGDVVVKDGAIIMAHGNGDMTGITWSGEYPRTNYEISLEAQRVDGSDFFCGLTFPLNETNATLVLGGWGGSVTGISCLDYEDASRNETMRSMQFKNRQWYRVRLKVTNAKFEAWVDDEQIVDVTHKGRKVDIRIECSESRPLGIATWMTTGAVRNIRIREMRPEEVEMINATAKDPNEI